MSKDIRPPFTYEKALVKVQFAEDAWNSMDPERISLGYSIDSNWHNRTEFFTGREAIKIFLTNKWKKETEYKLKKELWCHTDNRIAVRFEYEYKNAKTGQWMRCHGNEYWEFAEDGLMKRREMTGNDFPIEESERKFK
ncbi:nuclear transport factor 2 family protein (plasmid) [Bacillus mycoides]|nr:nuclear transport factor 2 family protein [Bacillus mycoides]